jgi:phosphoenolpyruvate synthase/pyruvate phosphate dikinase
MNQDREKTALENAHGNAVVWFTEEACREVEVAGGKGASLARMTTEGLPVPPGFVIPSYVLQNSIDAERMLGLAASHSTRELQELVAATEPPKEKITAAYENLVGGRRTATYKLVGNKKVAVRSSAVAEDSKVARKSAGGSWTAGRLSSPSARSSIVRRRAPSKICGWQSSCRRWWIPRSPA